MGVDASSECIFPFTQPEPNNGAQPGTSSSPNHPGPELTDPISSPAKGAADPDDGVTVEVSGSTGDHVRDSVGDVSAGKVNKGVEESNLGQ